MKYLTIKELEVGKLYLFQLKAHRSTPSLAVARVVQIVRVKPDDQTPDVEVEWILRGYKSFIPITAARAVVLDRSWLIAEILERENEAIRLQTESQTLLSIAAELK